MYYNSTGNYKELMNHRCEDCTKNMVCRFRDAAKENRETINKINQTSGPIKAIIKCSEYQEKVKNRPDSFKL